MTTVLISCPLFAQDIVGRWVGVASTTDESGVKRQERQTPEVKSQDGKLSGLIVSRNGGGFPLEVQNSTSTASSSLRVASTFVGSSS